MSLLDFFRPQWQHSSPAARAAAVRGITNSDLLVQIARTDKDKDVRVAAVRMLKDQRILADIARTDSNDSVRKAVVEQLKDQPLLIQIAKADVNPSVRSHAVERLTDQPALLEIAWNDPNEGVRVLATGKLINEAQAQAAYAELARSASAVSTRQSAVWKLTDRTLLAEVAKADSDPEVRRAATLRLGFLGRGSEAVPTR
jgi:hypothetical protein